MADRILAVPVDSDRTAPTREVARSCSAANPRAQVLEMAGVQEALAECSGDPFTVISGSLYLVGEALEHLSSPPAARSERDLNEWQIFSDKRS